MRINKQIREYIESNGLKFTFIAERCEIDIKKFSRFMNCKQPISTDEYELICKNGLKVEPSYFFQKKFLETKKNCS